MERFAEQDGGIITGWLLRLVVSLAIGAMVVFEFGAVAFAAITVDDAARDVARAAEVAYGSAGTLDAAEVAARDAAQERGVELSRIEYADPTLTVEVTRTAGTLFLHRLGAAEDLVTRTAERRVDTGM